jgi:hypothetical protein
MGLLNPLEPQELGMAAEGGPWLGQQGSSQNQLRVAGFGSIESARTARYQNPDDSSEAAGREA